MASAGRPAGYSLRGSAQGMAAVLVCALCAAAPSFSSAATVKADRACYFPGQAGRITGTGYTPNGEVALGFTIMPSMGRPRSSTLLVTADGFGNIDLRVNTPSITPLEFQANVFLSATDQEQAKQGPPPPVTAQWLISVRNVFVPPWELGTANPRKPARVFATGFTTATGRTLYAHYVLRGRLRETVAIGRLKGPCGDLTRRIKRQFPFRPVPAGFYLIKFDGTRRYPNKSPGVTYAGVRVRPANAVR